MIRCGAYGFGFVMDLLARSISLPADRCTNQEFRTRPESRF